MVDDLKQSSYQKLVHLFCLHMHVFSDMLFIKLFLYIYIYNLCLFLNSLYTIYNTRNARTGKTPTKLRRMLKKIPGNV